MYKTFKYHLYPTKSQKTKINQTLETCRQVYNQTLELRKSSWENEQKHVSLNETSAQLTKWKIENPYLTQVYAQALQEVQQRVDKAYRAFFQRVKRGQNPGFPRFKGRDRYDSFTYPQSGFKITDNEHIKLSKIGNIRIKIHRSLEGQIKTLTIQRDHLGNWFACFVCEVVPHQISPSSEVIGIDMGLKAFITTSDGQKIEHPKFFRQGQKNLAKVHRRLSKTEKSTSEHRKQKRAVSHAHQKVANQRKDFSHKLSRQFINKYQIIIFEDLEIQKMQQGNFRNMNRNIQDVAWSQFISFCTYKAEEAGRTLIKVDPRNTSQKCSGCGNIVKKDLSVRIHSCLVCNLILDRDHNAALNILALGLQSIDRNVIEALPGRE